MGNCWITIAVCACSVDSCEDFGLGKSVDLRVLKNGNHHIGHEPSFDLITSLLDLGRLCAPSHLPVTSVIA